MRGTGFRRGAADRAGQDQLFPGGAVEFTQEFVGQCLARPVVDDLPVTQRHGTRAITGREIDLVERDHHRDPVLAIDAGQIFHDPARRFRIEGGNRFVRQNNLRPLNQGTGDGGALLLAAGQGRSPLARVLVDADPASNPFNWQWVAGCGADAAPYFRIFNPTLQADKFDADGAYLRRWIPELTEGGYPDPIVDHKIARERALVAFKSLKRE